MKCRSCSSTMILDKKESGRASSTQWHRCTACGKVRLTSQLESLQYNDQHPHKAVSTYRIKGLSNIA